MLRLLERTVDSLDRRLVLLAPPGAVPGFFQNVSVDREHHERLIREMQALRGRIYSADGALGRGQLSSDGLHQTAEDSKSWHMLTMDGHSRVTGCAWYLQHNDSVAPHHLRVRHCPLAFMAAWREKLWKSVESEIARARRECLRYAEVGGWAVSEQNRRTAEGLVLALAGYGLGRISGECLGITTATVRHCSASILRRLGGAPLTVDGATVPPYYDPRYNCEMEILRFDSRRPNAKYATLVEMLRDRMANVRVIALPVADVVSDTGEYLSSASSMWTHPVPQFAFGA